ncbi:hypothetical protein EDD22DRAFT_854624 [Suillus occidentalis]|nr:hypothetical protein EDD22DRAFT_854624 [Suillus occidentalis]
MSSSSLRSRFFDHSQLDGRRTITWLNSALCNRQKSIIQVQIRQCRLMNPENHGYGPHRGYGGHGYGGYGYGVEMLQPIRVCSRVLQSLLFGIPYPYPYGYGVDGPRPKPTATFCDLDETILDQEIDGNESETFGAFNCNEDEDASLEGSVNLVVEDDPGSLAGFIQRRSLARTSDIQNFNRRRIWGSIGKRRYRTELFIGKTSSRHPQDVMSIKSERTTTWGERRRHWPVCQPRTSLAHGQAPLHPHSYDVSLVMTQILRNRELPYLDHSSFDGCILDDPYH